MSPFLTFNALLFCCSSILYVPTHATFMVGDYPNPLNNASLWKCGIAMAGTLCDPDSLLNESSRQEALMLLKDFPEQTDIDNNNDDGSCKSQGVTVGLALSKEPITTRNTRINVTDDLMKNMWKLDTRCNKALMLTLSVQPTPTVRFTRYMTTPVFDDELQHLIWTEMHWLREKNYIMWIKLVLDGVRAMIVDRHSTLQNNIPYSTVSCAGHGFVIFCTIVAIIVSVLITLSAPWLCEQCHRRFGHFVGYPAPFPMMRFTNRNGGDVGGTANGAVPQ